MPDQPESKAAGSPWLRELYDLFAPTRQSLRTYSEQEINDAIDKAVQEVRARQRNSK